MQSAKPATVDAYLTAQPEDVRQRLEQIRTLIREVAPSAEEKISYDMPTYFQNGVLVHFAAFKNHIGLYPTPVGMEAFKEELAPYQSGKGTARFPLDEPLPLELIAKIVKFRLQQNQEQATTKKRSTK